MLRVQYSFCTVCGLGRFGLIDKLSFVFFFCLHIRSVNTSSCYILSCICRCWVPQGSDIAQIVAVAPVHICAPGQVPVNKGTAAGLWSLAPYGVGKVVLLVGGGDV